MQFSTNRPRTALYLAIALVLAGAALLAAPPVLASAAIDCIGDANTNQRGGGASGSCIAITGGDEGAETVATVEREVPTVSVYEREWNTYCSGGGGVSFQEGFGVKIQDVWPLTDEEAYLRGLELGGDHKWQTYFCLGGASVGLRGRIVVDVTGNISPVAIRDSVRALLEPPHLVPGTNPPLAGHVFVQIPTWLWIDAATWSSIESSATSGIATVWVTATPTHATWVMHEGAEPVVCTGPGVVFQPGMSEDDTDCSYTYLNSSHGYPEGSFAASVTVTWKFEWWINGVEQGEFGTVDLVTPFSVRVGEIQIVET